MSSTAGLDGFLLNGVKKLDPDAVEVLSTCNQVKHFRYDLSANKWTFGNVEGTLIFYKRSEKPFFGFVLLSRESIRHWSSKFDHNVEIQIRPADQDKPAFLLHKSVDTSGDQQIDGLAFPENQGCEHMYKVIMEHTNLPKTAPSYAAMVANQKSEEAKRVQEKAMSPARDVAPKNKAAQSKNASTNNNRYAQQSQGVKPSDLDVSPSQKGSNPIPNRQQQAIMAPPQTVPVVSALDLDDPAIIEASFSSGPSQAQSTLSPLPNLAFPPPNSYASPQKNIPLAKGNGNLSDGLRAALGLNGPKKLDAAPIINDGIVLQSDLEEQTRFAREVSEKLTRVQEAGLVGVPNNGYTGGMDPLYPNIPVAPTTFYNSELASLGLINQVPLRAPHEFGGIAPTNNVATLTNEAFLLPHHIEASPAKVRADLPKPAAVHPLTKDQLLQAMEYLLRTDRDFVQKIHMAYVKSIMENLKL